jgi:hypothetical protein
VIKDAIAYANYKNVIMFAAASNVGGQDEVSWPAKSEHVICLHASDGMGNKSSFTPDLRKHTDNFSIIGMKVLSSSPSHLQNGPQVRMSGTSCATPVAAGIAANVLEIAGLYLSRQKDLSSEDETCWQDLRSRSGMCEVFRLMSRDRDGYDYIRPWRFVGRPGGYSIDVTMALLLDKLR